MDLYLKANYGIISRSVEGELILLPKAVVLKRTAKKMNYYVPIQQDAKQ